MDSDTESYLLLLLSDGNLPTGSFVASSGLEAYVKHGFFSLAPKSKPPTPPVNTAATVNFVRDSAQSYARTTLPLIAGVYRVCEEFTQDKSSSDENDSLRLERCMQEVIDLDNLYEATTLNHVARRASTTQGVALLTLLSRGLAKPHWMVGESEVKSASHALETLADELKLAIRKGDVHGHLPICWAVLTSVLGLSCGRSQHLFIFLHARSLLSASIRLNTIGPYAAQQLLLHAIKPIVHEAVLEASDASIRFMKQPSPTVGSGGQDKLVESDLEIDDSTEDGPVVTWPLGEILAARHDLQHSRIFNS